MPLDLSGNPSFLITFDEDADVDYVHPDLAASPVAATFGDHAVVAGGRLTLDTVGGSETAQGLALDPALFDQVGAKGTIRTRVRFLTVPLQDVSLFGIGGDASDATDSIHLRYASGDLILEITPHNSNTPVVSISGTFTPVQDQDYLIEIDFDFEAGTAQTRLFVDGVQIGSTSTGDRQAFAGVNAIDLGAGNFFGAGDYSSSVSGAASATDMAFDFFAVYPSVLRVSLTSVPRGIITYSKNRRYRSCGRSAS